jgi:predicted phage tail protein
MIKIIWIPNIVDSKNRKERVFKYNRDLTIKDYMQKAGINLDKNTVILSGKKIEDLTLKPKKNEDIIITPDVELFSTVAGMFWFWGSSLIYGALQIAAVSGMVAYGIYSMVSNPRKPVLNTATPNSPRGIDESSPTYGWDGIQTIQDVGVPVPILYGEHKVG